MHIVIIGNGIAGITAARFIRKLSKHRITVISSESKHFFARTALMYVYMGHMTYKDITPYEPWFWEQNRIELVQAVVQRIDPHDKEVHLDNRTAIRYDRLIVASGSRSFFPDIPGREMRGVQGLYSIQDLQRMEENSKDLKHAVIIGGGLIGIEMAEMFRSRDIDVTMLVREADYYGNILPKAEAEMINREIRKHGIDLRLNTEAQEIVGNAGGHAEAVITNAGERIPCGFVGITTGVKPNIDFLRNSGIACDTGILVDSELHTNVPGILAAGDCAEIREPQPGRKAIEPVWYTGRIMGEVAAYNACGYHIPYEPGVWYNSAKFFDIEYMVYGDVPTALPDDLDSLYWEHPKGNKSIRINFNKNSKAVTGFNLMGIRYRQEVCEKWIREHTPVDAVLTQLSLANFDPEFYRQYEQVLVDQYNQRWNARVSLSNKRNADSVRKFLAS